MQLLVAPKTEGSGSSRQSSAGSSQGPFQDAFAPRAPAASHLKPDTPNGTASVNSGSFSAGKLTPPAPPKGDSTPGATISSNSPSRGDAHHSLTTTSGDGGSGESGRLTVADANVMLGLLRDGGDVQGAVEVLSNMKLAGMWPDAESYHLVMETLLCAGQVGQATDVCMEGHADGVLQHFTLPDTQAIQNAARMSGQGGMLRAVSGVVNVERCSPPVAAVVWMAWAKCIVNLKRQGFQVEDPAVVVKISEGGPAAPAASVDNVARVIFGLLTTGQGCLPGVAPVIVPNSAGECLYIMLLCDFPCSLHLGPIFTPFWFFFLIFASLLRSYCASL